jgi:hypothetical protein
MSITSHQVVGRKGKMKLDFTPVFLAFGIGLATYLVLRLKKVNSDVQYSK